MFFCLQQVYGCIDDVCIPFSFHRPPLCKLDALKKLRWLSLATKNKLITFTNEFKIVKVIEVFYKLIPTIIPNEFQVVPTIADAAAAGAAAAAVAPFPFAPNTRRCLLLVARFLFCGARLLYVARLLASIDNRIVVSYDIGSRFGLLRIGQIQWHGFNIQ